MHLYLYLYLYSHLYACQGRLRWLAHLTAPDLVLCSRPVLGNQASEPNSHAENCSRADRPLSSGSDLSRLNQLSWLLPPLLLHPLLLPVFVFVFVFVSVFVFVTSLDSTNLLPNPQPPTLIQLCTSSAPLLWISYKIDIVETRQRKCCKLREKSSSVPSLSSSCSFYSQLSARAQTSNFPLSARAYLRLSAASHCKQLQPDAQPQNHQSATCSFQGLSF